MSEPQAGEWVDGTTFAMENWEGGADWRGENELGLAGLRFFLLPRKGRWGEGWRRWGRTWTRSLVVVVGWLGSLGAAVLRIIGKMTVKNSF